MCLLGQLIRVMRRIGMSKRDKEKDKDRDNNKGKKMTKTTTYRVTKEPGMDVPPHRALRHEAPHC